MPLFFVVMRGKCDSNTILILPFNQRVALMNNVAYQSSVRREETVFSLALMLLNLRPERRYVSDPNSCSCKCPTSAMIMTSNNAVYSQNGHSDRPLRMDNPRMPSHFLCPTFCTIQHNLQCTQVSKK